MSLVMFPPEALTMEEEDVSQVDLNLCFGCAVYATECESNTIKMVNKPVFETPPKDEKALMEAMFTTFAKQG